MPKALVSSLPDGRAPASILATPPRGSHIVKFYEEEASIVDAVCEFLRAGLRSEDALVVIATPPHREAFLGRLKGEDLDRARADGRIHLLDARESLARFMVCGSPDPDRFHRMVDEFVTQATGGQQGVRVRAFGEMVNLLWRDGLQSAALIVEDLWDEACASRGLALLCAYALGNFYKSGNVAGIAEVSAAHNHVLHAESRLRRTQGDDSSLAEDTEPSQRVRRLEAENDQLRELVQALRASNVRRLHDGQERFRLLVEGVRDYAIFMLDPTGIVTTWNVGAERIKGYSADEIVGRRFSTFYLPDDVAVGKCERDLSEALTEGRLEDEGWRIRKDGSRFWASVVITAVRDSDGNAIGFANVTRDLTDRVRAENERVQLARIEEAAHRRDEFLGIMGHELRNPLAPLVTAAHMIRLRGGRANEKEMGLLDRQLRQMTRIVSDLLDASRLMQDKVELSLRDVEIGEIIADAVDMASPLIEARQHALEIAVPDHGLMVRADSGRMAQVFGNILNNAAKYTETGGTIAVRASRHEDEVAVIVEDDGQGIAPEGMGRIFDLFAQGDRRLERTGGGLGIGLAVAKRLVRAHQGAISAESEGIGRGSRFTVRLPRIPSPPRVVSEPATAPVKTLGTPRRVLIVDDNRDSVTVMQALLELCGHEVHVAFDGAGALEICKAFVPELVLLDIGLPEMDGYEVVRRIRAIAACAKIPIIAVSGYARAQDRARAIESGFTAHLPKPVDFGHLTDLLELADQP
jgi:PAS domain S-box-containing protein